MKKKMVRGASVLLLSLSLMACQNTQTGTKVIAGVFQTSTKVQQKMIDRHAPKAVLTHANIRYWQSPELRFDLYQPDDIAQLQPRPTVVWIHGGGWISGSKEHARGYLKLLAQQGYNVVSVQYEFAPKAVYPAQLNQINQAFAFLMQHAEQFNIDPQQFYLAGDSAGANLASHYAALVTNPEFSETSNFAPKLKAAQIKGLILHCGIYDLSDFIRQAPEEMKLLEWGIYRLVQAYTGDQKDNIEFLAKISPRQHLTPHYPPVLISGGNKDFLTQRQSMPFVEALKQQNIAVTTAFYPDSKEFLLHEYQFMMGKKASQETFAKTLTFLRRYSPD